MTLPDSTIFLSQANKFQQNRQVRLFISVSKNSSIITSIVKVIKTRRMPLKIKFLSTLKNETLTIKQPIQYFKALRSLLTSLYQPKSNCLKVLTLW